MSWQPEGSLPCYEIYRWQDQLWLLAQLNAPKTHDADSDPAQAFSRTELFTVTVTD
ncbi:MAG: hypothetical protein AB7O24_09570 [Kofleriaceae bacterium]